MLLKDPEIRNSVAERGHRHLSVNFSEERLLRTLDAAYQELIRTDGKN
jgi:hypothetical protein